MTPEPQSEWPFGKGRFEELGRSLGKMFESARSAGPLHWETARRVAQWVALTGRTEQPVADVDAAQLRELARVAQVHVAERTGLVSSLEPSVHVVGRSGWVELNLESLGPTLERLSRALQAPPTSENVPELAARAMLELQQTIFPMVAGMQAGVMVGYLAHHMLGQYDVPLPASGAPRLVFVVPNLDAFQEAWSLERDDFRFYVALHEVVHATVLAVPWVREQLVQLVDRYVSAFEPDPNLLRGQFSSFDLSDQASMESLMADPSDLLRAMRSPAQAAILPEIQILTTTLTGYTDAVIEQAGAPLIATFPMIREAMRRHRVERGGADRFVGHLLGLEATREHDEQGSAFARGVIERAGLERLNRLWERETMLPTQSELEAPGLWLARIDLED